MSQGAIAEVQYLQQQNRLQELQSEIAQTGATLREVQAESIKSKQQIQRELADLERQLVETNKSKEYESLRAPVKGYVFDLIVIQSGLCRQQWRNPAQNRSRGNTGSQVCLSPMPMWDSCAPRCRPKSALMPTPSPNTAIFQASSNALASSRLEPDQQNPEPRFPALVVLDRQYVEKRGKRFPVSAGQSVSVNFIVRDKPVISLLTDSVEKAFDALRGIKTDQP